MIDRLENYRETMDYDVLHSWATDAQKELEILREALREIEYSDECASDVAREALHSVGITDTRYAK